MEGLLLGLLWTARSAFFAQALALASALLATPWLGRPDAPPWLESAVRSCLWLGATFLLTGVLLVVARHLPLPRVDDAAPPGWPWPWALGLSLAALPVLAYAGASDLAPLWREILTILEEIGFWEVLGQSDPYAGIVVIPVAAALFVPALQGVAAFFLIAVPLGLIVLLATRSHLFPTLFAMTVACQAGLVLASLIAADAFSRLATQAIAVMAAAPDVEVHRAAEQLRGAQGILASVATSFVAPLLGYLVGATGLWLSRGAGAFSTAGPIEAAPRSAEPGEPAALRSTPSTPAHPPTALPGPSTPARIPPSARRARVGLAALGSLLLVFSAAEALRSRAPYESSDPAPGAALAAAPRAVRVSFGRALDPSSSLSITRTMARADAAAEPTTVAASSGLDPDDPQQRTLKAELTGASGGLYRATWRSLPASGGIARHGSFTFAVGMPAPELAAGGAPPLEERDAGERRRRQTLVGGALLVVLGALLPRLALASR